MKLTKHDNSMETNTETESQSFSIGDASQIIKILRDHMYEHKVRTLVQEYMSNGRDAMREAKTKKRIVVSVPNALSPVFKVRDFGVGLSPERIKNVFVKYGSSTKKNTNSQTGGFGIGAKSAWCYTDSFTVVSIVDGWKRTYVAHIGSNSTGSMDMLSEVETNEPTGTEIQVAVRPNDINAFRDAVLRASYFWKESERPEFKGITSDPTHFFKGGLKIGDLEVVGQCPSFIEFKSWDHIGAVIDGIPYALSESLVDKIDALSNLKEELKTFCVLHIGNGVVKVSASRESISDSDVSCAALKDLALQSSKALVDHVKTQFKAVKSNADWVTTYKELSRLVECEEHSKFGNYRIENSAVVSDYFKDLHMVRVQTKRRGGKQNLSSDAVRFVNIDQLDNVFYIDNANETQIIKNRRIREHFAKFNRASAILIDATEIKGFDVKKTDRYGNIVAAPTVTTSLADSKKSLVKVITDLGAKPLSSLPFTPVVREPRATRDRTKEEFTLHVMGYGDRKHTQTTTLAAVVGGNWSYVWAPYKDYEKLQKEFTDLMHFFEEQKTKLCFVTDKTLDMLEGCDKFVKYADWKANFKPTAAMVTHVKSQKATNTNVINLLRRADLKVKDKHIAKMMEEYGGLSKGKYIPESLYKMVFDEVKSFIEDDKELTRLVKECYSLVGVVADLEHRFKKNEANELVTYINAKI